MRSLLLCNLKVIGNSDDGEKQHRSLVKSVRYQLRCQVSAFANRMFEKSAFTPHT
jgi:hypothetical protein